MHVRARMLMFLCARVWNICIYVHFICMHVCEIKSIANYKEFLMNEPSTVINSRYRPQMQTKLKSASVATWISHDSRSRFILASCPNLSRYNVHHSDTRVCKRVSVRKMRQVAAPKITRVKESVVNYVAGHPRVAPACQRASTRYACWWQLDKILDTQVRHTGRGDICEIARRENWNFHDLFGCDCYHFAALIKHFKALTCLLV